MRFVQLMASVLFAAVAVSTVPASAQQSSRFDGRWSVTVVCDQASDRAAGYTWQFPAEVRGGMLHGVYGTLGEAMSLDLAGQISADGAATLMAHGFTGSDRRFNVGSVSGKLPFSYRVSAQFAGGQGEGTRLETRPCKLHFRKQ